MVSMQEGGGATGEEVHMVYYGYGACGVCECRRDRKGVEEVGKAR